MSIRILVKLLIKFNWVIWNEMCMYLFSIVNYVVCIQSGNLEKLLQNHIFKGYFFRLGVPQGLIMGPLLFSQEFLYINSTS